MSNKFLHNELASNTPLGAPILTCYVGQRDKSWWSIVLGSHACRGRVVTTDPFFWKLLALAMYLDWSSLMIERCFIYNGENNGMCFPFIQQKSKWWLCYFPGPQAICYYYALQNKRAILKSVTWLTSYVSFDRVLSLYFLGVTPR